MLSSLIQCIFAGIPGPPGTPEVFDVSRDGMTLTWYPPEDDGDSQITGYIVERKEVRADRWIRVNKVPVTMTRYRSTGLVEGLEYEHRVTAINARGTGKPSRPSKSAVARDPIGNFLHGLSTLWQKGIILAKLTLFSNLEIYLAVLTNEIEVR